MKINKINVVCLLDKVKIVYEFIFYEVDESDLSVVYVVVSLGENINQVFKIFVFYGDKMGYFVCVILGDQEVNLKFVVKVFGNKSCDMIFMKEFLFVIGYIWGVCLFIGMKKYFFIYIYEICLGFLYIYVSVGQRGLQIKIDFKELINEVWVEVCVLYIV